MKTTLRLSRNSYKHPLLYISLLLAPMAGIKAQGTGNHLTMYLNNCVQPAANVLQFDVWAISDGAANSDLRASAFQFGINFNTAILNTGDSITPSHVTGTTDSLMPNLPWCYPHAISPDHIRFVQEVGVSNNSGLTMVLGHSYRIGTFQLTCATSYVNLSNPNLSLQAPVARGKTVSEGLIYIDSATCTTSFYVTGTTDNDRALNVSCSIILTSLEDIADNSNINIYPNPSHGVINISLDKNLKDGLMIIYNVLGEKVYSDGFNGKQKTIALNLSAGVYYINIKDNERQYIHKIVVQ